ncbi:MAG: DUF1570 domain-containing protein [Planctomycetota bacterium]|nr:DUF1570 domain-containing protein [Planctomycetota bacterium]
MGSPTSSQRISFAQLVLDMGLADAKGLAEAKKKIKEAQAGGQKLTIARACVDLGILTEKQAKRVQLELKRLKEGLASSSEFTTVDADAEAARPSREGKARRASAEGKTDEKKKAPEDGEAKAGDDEPVARKKRRDDSAEGKVEAKKAAKDDSVEAKVDAPEGKKKRKDDSAEGKVDAPEGKKKRKDDSAEGKVEAKADDAEGKKRRKDESVEGKVDVEGKKKRKDDSAEGKVEAKKGAKADEPEAKKKRKDDDAEADEAEGKKKPAKADEEKQTKKAPAVAAEPDSDASDAPASAAPESDASDAPASDSDAPASDSESDAKGKASLGKEIELDSQRAAAAAATATAAAKPVTKRRAAPAAKKAPPAAKGKEAEPGVKPPSKAPLLALGGLVLLLLALAIGVAMHDDKKPQQPVAGVAAPTPPGDEAVADARPVTPSDGGRPVRRDPTPSAGALSGADKRLEAERKMDTIAMAAGDLADQGKLREAIERLETFPSELRDQPVWKEVGQRDIARYRELLVLQDELDAALGGDKNALIAMVKKVEDPSYARRGEAPVARFRAKAREVLGDREYDRVLAKMESDRLGDLDDVLSGGSDRDDDGPNVAVAEVESRGSDARRSAMREAAKVAQGNLAAAQKTLEQRRAARRQQVQAEADRVIKYTRKDKLKFEGKEVQVTGYDEDGFTVKLGRDDRTYSWGNAPAELAHEVKFRATDTNSGQAVFDLGLYAVRRGLFDHARRHFERAVKIDASLNGKAPDLTQLETRMKLFRGRNKLGGPGESSEVQWKFEQDRPQEALDFKGFQDGMDATMVGGALKVSAQGYPVSAVRVRGNWEREASIQLVLASVSPPPIVGIASEGELIGVSFGDKTNLVRPFGRDNQAPMATSEVRATQGTTVKLTFKRSGEQMEVAVKVGDRDALKHTFAWEGEFSFMLGVRGNSPGVEARFDDIVCAGDLSQGWIKRTQAAAPNEIVRFLNDWQRARESGGGEKEQVPYCYRKTSAEDEVATRGVRPEAIELVGKGRQMLEQNNFGGALDAFRRAAEMDPDYHAAAYLHSIMLVRRDLEQLFRVERALKGVEDFYEAMVIKGETLIYANKVADSKALLAKALELRPDYPPAYLLKARLEILEGKYSDAVASLELASVLGPGDPFIIQTTGEARALADGPGWANKKRVTTKNYIVDTDYVDHAERFTRVLEAIRSRYVEAFPNLVNPDAPKRAASVLVFNEAEDYYVYSEQTTNDRKENTGGHFNPMTGQLLLFLDATSTEPGALHVLQHEAMHQWAHAQSLALPFWANEGMAEYIGATLVTDAGEITDRTYVNSFLKGRLKGMRGWHKTRMRWHAIMTQSPQEFYSGKGGNPSFKYGQAWTMIHFFMESGYKVTTIDGDEKPIKDIFFDYLNKYKAIGLDHGARGGSKLEYVYVDTFHQIDNLAKVEEDFAKYVVDLAKRAGVDFMSPEEASKLAGSDDD